MLKKFLRWLFLPKPPCAHEWRGRFRCSGPGSFHFFECDSCGETRDVPFDSSIPGRAPTKQEAEQMDAKGENCE